MPENAYDSFIKHNPLSSAVEKSKNIYGSYKTLKYPDKDDNQYLGRLIFEVVDENKYKSSIGIDLNNIFKDATTFASGFIGTLFSGLFSGTSGGSFFTGGTTVSANPTSYATDPTFPKIVLYLPQALNIMDAVTYDNAIQLGVIGAAAEKSGMVSGEETANALLEGIGAMGGKLGPEVSSIIAQNRAKQISENAANGLRSRTQVASNPNTRTLFKEVPIRQFTFTFTMIATSASEAAAIEQIIKAFRTELYPESLAVGGIDYAYQFPRRFLIKAVYNNREWPGIKFLPTYLQSFNTVYNPNGMGFHRDGKWTEVQITMTFSESRALSKQDIKNGY